MSILETFAYLEKNTPEELSIGGIIYRRLLWRNQGGWEIAYKNFNSVLFSIHTFIPWNIPTAVNIILGGYK